MHYKTEIIKTLRQRRPIETARLEQTGELRDVVEQMARNMRQYQAQMEAAAFRRINKAPSRLRHQVVSEATRRAQADNMESLHRATAWEPAAEKRARAEGISLPPENVREEILKPYLDETRQVCGSEEEAREMALDLAETMGAFSDRNF